ncbi:histidine kinase [Streptomyces sp. NPDC001833]|uniref:sensor histidine kinase n=1 Tax=Streptomyces sp. NPDC001833 TaxID=3154658 RepID=UPI0033204E27
MSDILAGQASTATPRLAAALEHARQRRERRNRRLRPVLWCTAAALGAQTVLREPASALPGPYLSTALVLAALLIVLTAVAAGRWSIIDPARCTAFCLLVAGLGLALGFVRPGGVSVLPSCVAVLTVFLLLPARRGLLVLAFVLAGLILASLAGHDGGWGDLLDQFLFCGVLAVTGLSARQASDSEERAELLLAQLEDAREAEAEAVKLAERARIAQDLHDVLAQTLSGLAIQVQAARRMARRDQAEPQLRDLLDRTGQLVKEGLDDARRAVGALRGDQVPSLDQLAELVERYRSDLGLDITLRVTGTPRAVEPQAQLALYRGAQEALTNVARHARGSRTTVTLAYLPAGTALTVADHRAHRVAASEPFLHGSGLGLAGMRERLADVGGTVEAGPSADGWTVRMEIPA